MKLNMDTPDGPEILPLKVLIQYRYKNFHSRIVRTSKILETTYMSIIHIQILK